MSALEHIVVTGCPTCGAPAQAIAGGEGVRYRHVDTATLKAAQGGVTEAMVREIVERYIGKTSKVSACIAEDLQAAISAQQGQGEAVAYMTKRGAVYVGKHYDPGKGDVPLYTAPPAQPAERGVEGGVSRIAAERQRQKDVEGWTPGHDASHGNATLTKAAICYAVFAASAPSVRDDVRHTTPKDWPWESSWWKPGADNANASRIRELEKAGALIAAEIDRLTASPAPSSARGDGGEG